MNLENEQLIKDLANYFGGLRVQRFLKQCLNSQTFWCILSKSAKFSF